MTDAAAHILKPHGAATAEELHEERGEMLKVKALVARIKKLTEQ